MPRTGFSGPFKYVFDKTRPQMLMGPLDSTPQSPNWKGRRYRRFDLEFPVLIKVQSDSVDLEFEAVSKNVSVGGLLIRTTNMVQQNTHVSFVLSVHGERAVRPIHLMGEGNIVRAESRDSDATFELAIKCKAPVTQLEAYLPS